MCRIGLTINTPKEIAEQIASLQINGGSRAPEFWSNGRVNFAFNRLDVTSSRLPHGEFPLEGQRFVKCYNGEVFEFRGKRFNQDSTFHSDVHFALDAIEQFGYEAFFSEADIHGSFLLFDKETGDTIVVVDQLNICGCFYATYGKHFVLASEFPVVHKALALLGADSSVAIDVVKNGTMLVISPDNQIRVSPYRPIASEVWTGTEFSEDHLNNCIVALDQSLTKSVEARIPKCGDVGVLVGGGVDSSLLLAKTLKALRHLGQEHRLRVFIFGEPDIGLPDEFNDLFNVRHLLTSLDIDEEKLTVISPEAIREERAYALQNKVYCDDPRLITPDPVRTQCRHVVTMSCVLAHIADEFPEITAVLSGDGADELFAGYNSMSHGVADGEGLRKRIHDKLDDFPLNDAGRVALACYHGASVINKHIHLGPAILRHNPELKSIDDVLGELDVLSPAALHDFNGTLASSAELTDAIRRTHPIEVRMPFTSHYVLESLKSAHIDYATGIIDGKRQTKFLLRLVAGRNGLPKQIVLRHKVPFNEGGCGVRNSDVDPLEVTTAQSFISEDELAHFVRDNEAVLRRLGVDVTVNGHVTRGDLLFHYDKLALVAAAHNAGLDRLLGGNAFRDQMPDSLYSTDRTGDEYICSSPFSINPWES